MVMLLVLSWRGGRVRYDCRSLACVIVLLLGRVRVAGRFVAELQGVDLVSGFVSELEGGAARCRAPLRVYVLGRLWQALPRMEGVGHLPARGERLRAPRQ